MKNRLKLVLSIIFVLTVCMLLMLTGCKGKNEVTDAYITNSNLPRTTYVVGQDFDFSKGYLTVVRGGEETNVPFSAEGITLAGYDKNTVGDQTVTVSYNDASATFTVKVVPRVTAENYETKYFVTDTFDKTKGRLRVANDDAKIVTVNFSDPKVSVVSFDTDTAGTKTVTLKYTSGSSSYTCSFDVTVYEAANIEYSAPKKIRYNSHYATLADKDVKDGYFTVTSSDGKLTKVVPITADMVKGYTPSLATIENRDTALKQTLKIEYLGNSYDYNVEIIFSGISVVEYYANGALKNLDLTKPLSNEQSLAALDAVTALLDLSPADRASLAAGSLNTVVRSASIGVTDLFMQELAKCQNAFAMDEAGNFGLILNTYSATKDGLEKLTNPESKLNVYVTVLRQLLSEYPNTEITAEERVSDVIIVYSKESEDLYIPIIEHAVQVHELLMNVPDNWTVDTIGEYSAYIIDAAILIGRSEVYQQGLGAIYTDRMSGWRAHNDLLEVVYSFFLYAYEGDENYMQNNLFGKFPMPGELEDLYQQLMVTYNIQMNLYQGMNGELWMSDLSTYAASYFLTIDLAKYVKSSGNRLWLDIYEKYNLDFVISNYTGAQNVGFDYYAGAMIDSDTFFAIWEQYYAVLQLYLTNNLDAIKHEALIFALVDTFQSMNPNEVFGFLSSLNLGYGDARGSLPVLYLDFEENAEANIFATILREYYCEYLTDKNVAIFADLLMAIESGALFGENEYVLSNFVGYMEAVTAAKKALTDKADIDNFDKYLGKSYKKCLDLYNRILGEYTETPTEAELALIVQLRADVKRYDEIYTFIVALGQQYTEAHEILLYTAFARAAVTYNTLLANASDAAIAYLFTEGFTFMNLDMTLAKAYFQVDWRTTIMMQGSASYFPVDGKTAIISHWDALADYGLLSVYAGMSDLLYYALVDSTAIPDAQKLNALATEIGLLTEFGADLFNYFGGASAYYNAKCTLLLNETKDEAALTVLNALSTAAEAYANYRMYSTTASYKNDFLAAMTEATAAYETLSDATKATVAEVYEYYLSVNEALSA